MLTDIQIRRHLRTTLWIALGSLGACCLFAVFYFSLVYHVREPVSAWATAFFGQSAKGYFFGVLFLPIILIFLVPLIWVDRFIKRSRMFCPNCEQPLILFKEILTTRRCPACEEQIVEGGKPRSSKTYRRSVRIKAVKSFPAALWLITLHGCFFLVWWYFDRASFHDFPERVAVFPLLTTMLTGWVFASKRRRQYLPQFVISTISLILAIAICTTTP